MGMFSFYQKHNVVHSLVDKKLLIAINCVAGLSIFFFGYDQGVMGGVNNSYDYLRTVNIGYVDSTGAVHITNSLRQGGIVAIYYLGTLIGALAGGYIGDRIGRIKTVVVGCAWAIFGASFQCSAQNVAWMCCARIITGIGTGHLNAIVPVWAAETATHTSRGQFIAIEFTLNIAGVVVAYWLEFGMSFVDGGRSAARWRFPIAFQVFMLLILMAIIGFFPESPRWLVKMGRSEEAFYILTRLRGNDPERARAELNDIQKIVELEKQTAKRNSYFSMFFGIGSGNLHLGRRVQLVIWLQIIQEWVGIAAITVYQPTIFALAGYASIKSQWLSGLNNTFYMFSTLIAVFTLDSWGRRVTLFWGAVVQGIAMFLLGGFTRLAINRPDQAAQFGAAAAAMTFLFTSTFGATWLTVPWLYPTETFPLEVRARGNAFGVVGWSIGNGWLTLLVPVMIASINEKTFYIFAACNVVSIPIVYCLYPETANRTLEEMDLLFAHKSPWVWSAEKEFLRLKQENPDMIQGAKHGERQVDPEKGHRIHRDNTKPGEE